MLNIDLYRPKYSLGVHKSEMLHQGFPKWSVWTDSRGRSRQTNEIINIREGRNYKY